MSGKTYEDGIIEGRIMALENIASKHEDRFDSQGRRLRILERLVWATGGAMVFLQTWPTIGRVLVAMLPAAAGINTGGPH